MGRKTCISCAFTSTQKEEITIVSKSPGKAHSVEAVFVVAAASNDWMPRELFSDCMMIVKKEILLKKGWLAGPVLAIFQPTMQ